MATRGYPPQQHHYQQHQQPPPPQRQYGYDQRSDPRWQDPQQYQRMPPPRQQQPPPPQQQQHQYRAHDDPYAYQQGYDGYDQSHDQQQGYYQDQQYQGSQQHNDRYYDEHRGHPPPQREYHYDERYQQQSQGRQPPQMNGMASQQPPRPREQQRPPPLQEQQRFAPSQGQQRLPPPQEQKKPKPRERILARPESPEVLSWDNPFGAFPAKKDKDLKKDKKHERSAKEENHQRHGSLDSKQPQPAEWDAQHRRGDQQDSRPHTSHGHRKNNEPPRPNTSHAQRPPAAPAAGFENDEMRFNWRQPDPVGPSAIVEPLRRNAPPAPQSLPTRPAPQRSFTQPNQSNTGVAGVNGYDYNRPANDKHAMVGLRPPNRQSDHQYDHDPNYGAPMSKSHTYDQPRDGPEMPNFDAIAPNVAETLTGPKAVETPVYAKKSYQALAIETKTSRPPPPRATDSPLADFSFDLPHSNSAPPEMDPRAGRFDSRQQQSSAMGQYDHEARNRGHAGPAPASAAEAPFDYNNPPLSPPIPPQGQRNYDPRLGAQGPSRNQNQTPTQYPPRGASRAEPEASRNPGDQFSQQDSGYWATSPEQKAVRPDPATDSRAGPGYGRNGSTGYDQRQPFDQSYGDQYAREGYGQREGYGRDQHGQGYDRRSPPRQGLPPGGPSQGLPQRPATSNSAHPVPVRNYGDRVSGDISRPDMPPSVVGGMDRPPPVRPGLLGNPAPQQRGPSGTSMQQQPPMRQQQPPPTMQPVPQAAPRSQRTSTSSEENKAPVTIAELNQMREHFKEHPNDFALGLRFSKRLVEAAKVLSDEGGRADPKTVARNRERYINDAHKVVKKMVNAGSTEAMFYMADCYGQGSLGLPVDAKEAFHLYQSAAKMNHPQSAYRVAVCCELGTEDGGGTRRDPMKAIQWYKRAATLGDTPAMYKMGMILLKGLLGQQRDPRQAVSWLKRAAERADKDNPHALHELGLLYESAKPEDHILRDERYAFDLFHQAAELGYKYSQFRLGSVYEYGALGCPMDQRMSIQWYSKAAQQGEHQSELALSGWYLTGANGPNGEVLVQPNDQEAFLWSRKAASSGLAKAEFAMGYFSENGIGTRADIEEAKRWYYRAAAQGFPKARERLEELKMGAKSRKKDIRRSNAKEGDCVVM